MLEDEIKLGLHEQLGLHMALALESNVQPKGLKVRIQRGAGARAQIRAEQRSLT